MAEKLFSNRIKRANRSAGKAICGPKSMVFLALAIVLGVFFIVQTAQAPSYVENSKFRVAFEMDSSLTTQTLYITIENKQDSPDDLNIMTIIMDTNFPADLIRDSIFHVQNKEEYESPIYETACNPYNTTTEPNATHPNGTITEYPNCTTTEIGTETKERLIWQEKSLTYKQSSNQEYKEHWENVPIAKAGLEKSIKKFKLEFSTPIVKTKTSRGSKGMIYLELNGELFYDFEDSSWWDASRDYKKPLLGYTGTGSSVTTVVLVNDSIYNLSGGATDQLTWCYYTIPATWGTVGYSYYNDETDEAFTNDGEDAQVPCRAEEGNLTAYGNPWNETLIVLLMNESNVNLTWDFSGNGWNASLETNATVVEDEGVNGGNAVNFTDDSDHILLPTIATNSSLETEGAWEIWWKPEHQCDSTQGIHANHDRIYRDANGAPEDVILLNGDGRLHSPNICDGATSLYSLTATWLAGQWYHIVITWNESNIYLYINGTVENDTCGRNAAKWGVPDPSQMLIGYRAGMGGIQGTVDNFIAWNRTLTADEVEFKYNNTIEGMNMTELGVEIFEELEFVSPTPANATYSLLNYIYVNATSSENVTACSLEWDDGSPTNESMTINNNDDNTTCYLNMTSLSDGEYLFIVYGNLIVSGLSTTGERNVTIDTVDPTVSITEPFSIETSTQFYINYSANDTSIGSCWYSLDSGANTTISSCANTTVNISTGGTHSVEVYANDTAGNIGGDTKSFTVALFNLNVYNATGNGTVTDWHVYLLNGTADNSSQFTNNNTLRLNMTDIPTGTDVEMVIWKSGHGNATFNLSINGTVNVIYERHIIGDNFFVTLVPSNDSIQFAGEAFTLNISLPNYAEGNGSIWYALNGSQTYTLGCSNCTGFSRSISFRSGSNAIFGLINNSQHYLGVNGENKTHNITVFNSKYNISFFDEITNKSIDFSANKNGTIEFFCSNKTVTETVTGTIHEFILNCTGSLDIIKFKLFDPKGDHYRELIPTSRIGNLTFYMINTTPAAVVVNKVTFLVTDASLLYQTGIMHFKKIILGEGERDIIDTVIGSDGKVYASLMGEETYTISVESSDGTNSKTLGEYTVPDTTATSQPLTIIDVRFIPTAYNYIGTDISWVMQFNTSMGRIYFYWNDSTEQTTSIRFWIYNITNVSARTQMYYDTVTGESHHLFQWDYVTNGNENDTYLGYFEVIHGIHGNITESRPLAKGGIFYQWLGNIGAWYHIFSVFIIVFVASIFGAKSAPIGAVILAIIAGFLFYIEWLPSIMAGAVRLTDLLMLSLIALSILAMFIIKRRRI